MLSCTSLYLTIKLLKCKTIKRFNKPLSRIYSFYYGLCCLSGVNYALAYTYKIPYKDMLKFTISI